ncbi:MAG: TIR domain-containing protein, partial [Acidobacteriaceae bacterium]|nr:TIR domain-containing protein [Acidobacteriaceae bacterium]MBV9767418.1 TIR domain-containing protein [Acidobacteriaceae bacterium]
MTAIKPRIFVSYSRKDSEFVGKISADLNRSGIECWIDISSIQAGDRLKRAIFAEGIPECNLFFAYVTRHYLESHWCMQELRQALETTRVLVTPFADSRETMEAIPSDIRDEVHCGLLGYESYWPSILELSGKAWESLQIVRRLVSSADHILTGPAIFDSEGYRRTDLLKRIKNELILAAANLRSWLSDAETRASLIDMVKRRRIRVTLILATYETLRAISAEGAAHLRQSVEDIKEMLGGLDESERKLMKAHFHVGATTLSAVFIDPERPDGVLFFNPRWAIQFLPQDRLTCVIDKTINSAELFKAIHNSVFLMTQRDAKTIDEMLAYS